MEGEEFPSGKQASWPEVGTQENKWADKTFPHSVHAWLRPQFQPLPLLGCGASLRWAASFLSHQNSPKQTLARTLTTSAETITKQVNKQNSNTTFNILIGMSRVGNVHGSFKRLSRRFWWVIRLGRHCCEGYNSAQTAAGPLMSMVTFSLSHWAASYACLHALDWDICWLCSEVSF